ncbi:MAG: SPOR domain-containing protein [Sulfuritalea sp.]|nr:SPOR domain-containing protein [Sulfuritalea sp.]
MKKRARRRLVGAAALALFAVLVLPMVMDREPRPLNQDIQVRIPSQDATGLAAKVIPGKPVASPMPAPEAVAEPKPEPKSEVKAEPVAAPAPAAKPAEKSAPPEKKAAPDKKPVAKTAVDAKPAPAASGQWVVQLGAYKETGNVKLLLAKLKGIGVPAYTENFDSPQGPRTRVRAGPFPSQEAAEKARSRIKIIGVDGPVAPK